MDEKRIEKAFEDILEAMGEDRSREGLEETPQRIAKSYQELFSGLHQDPRSVLNRCFHSDLEDYVVQKDLDFFSMCEHHFLPFFGKVGLVYQANGKILGFGDIVKLVEILARRPQIQERFTEEIATYLYEALDAKGVFVKVEAQHLCMTMRGEKATNARITTVASKGCFKESSRRLEALQLLGK